MASLRLIVAVLVVGVIGVATDAQALACEFVCARPQTATAPHQHGAMRAMPSNDHASHVEHMGRGDMHHGLQATRHFSEGQLAQCVAVDDVTLRATMSRDVTHPPIAIGQTTDIAVAPIIHRAAVAAIAGSPPARNGPLQTSSILRI